jgi:hypothetical protein
MPTDYLSDVTLNESILKELNILGNQSVYLFNEALKQMQELAKIHDHINDKFHKALLTWAIQNKREDVDPLHLPNLVSNLEYLRDRGVVVGFEPRQSFTIKPDGTLDIKQSPIKLVENKEIKDGGEQQ